MQLQKLARRLRAIHKPVPLFLYPSGGFVPKSHIALSSFNVVFCPLFVHCHRTVRTGILWARRRDYAYAEVYRTGPCVQSEAVCPFWTGSFSKLTSYANLDSLVAWFSAVDVQSMYKFHDSQRSRRATHTHTETRTHTHRGTTNNV